MSVKPRISVIIPYRNHENFLEQAVRSAAEQIYRPLEIIIADDASDIPAREVIDPSTYAVPVRIFRREKHRGVSAP